MQAFFGNQDLKQNLMAQIESHIKAGELVQYQGLWKNGKGDLVGCCTHSEHDVSKVALHYEDFESLYGVPKELVEVGNAIFHELPHDEATERSKSFLRAIHVGADLRPVTSSYFSWLLFSTQDGMLRLIESKELVDAVHDYYERELDESTRESVSIVIYKWAMSYAHQFNRVPHAARYASRVVAHAVRNSFREECCSAFECEKNAIKATAAAVGSSFAESDVLVANEAKVVAVKKAAKTHWDQLLLLTSNR